MPRPRRYPDLRAAVKGNGRAPSLLREPMSRLPLLTLALMGCASVPRHGLADARAWPQVSSWLTGTWLATTDGGSTPVTMDYRRLSNDSVLVEAFVPASGRETMTVVHPDGDSLVLTHYCGQGNQPRLFLSSVTDDELRFRLADVTNRRPDASVLVEKRYRHRGAQLEQTEIYEAPDGSLETTVWTLTRAP